MILINKHFKFCYDFVKYRNVMRVLYYRQPIQATVLLCSLLVYLAFISHYASVSMETILQSLGHSLVLTEINH